MGKLRNNEKGFSAVEVILVLVVIIAIGVVGWLVYKDVHKANKATTASTASNTGTKTPKATPKTTTAASYKSYMDTAAKASFQYPSTWTIASIRGNCDELNGCAPSTDQTSAVDVTSPDGSMKLVWSGISGIGGYCDNTLPPTQSGGCTSETVFSATPIPMASGFYAVEGATELSSGQYQPFLAVQDKTGAITTGEPGLWYQSFTLPSTGHGTVFHMDNIYSDTNSTATPQTFSTLKEAQDYFSSTNAAQAKQILLSFQVQ